MLLDAMLYAALGIVAAVFLGILFVGGWLIDELFDEGREKR